jgi:hypothetical protein
MARRAGKRKSHKNIKKGLTPYMDIQPKDTSRGHFYVSLAKSGLRILAGVFLIDGNFYIAGSLLILAEGLGILEELV